MAENRQKKAVTKHFTREQLQAMSVTELQDLLGSAGGDVKFKAKGVVRRADGSIKYDDPSMKGQYGESEVEVDA